MLALSKRSIDETDETLKLHVTRHQRQVQNRVVNDNTKLDKYTTKH